MKKLLSYIAVLLLFTVSACSSNEATIITKDSETSTENTLIVLGIKFTDTFVNPDTDEIETVISHQLLKDEKLLEKRLIKEGKPELRGALYYLSQFRLIMEDGEGNDVVIRRFSRDIRGYEPAGIYQVKPGELSFDSLITKHRKAKDYGKFKEREHYKDFMVEYSEDFGSWQLPVGKVVYLGDLTFHFKTRQRKVGILTEKLVNTSITLMKVTLDDELEKTKAYLKENKTWFPADQMVNLASKKEWIISQSAIDNLEELKKEYAEETKNKPKDKEKKGADDEKKKKKPGAFF